MNASKKFTIENRIENLQEIRDSWAFCLLPIRWQAFIRVCITDLKDLMVKESR